MLHGMEYCTAIWAERHSCRERFFVWRGDYQMSANVQHTIQLAQDSVAFIVEKMLDRFDHIRHVHSSP